MGGEQSGLAKSSGAEAENGERGTSSDYAEGNLQNEIPTNAVEETETNTDMAALSEKKIRTVNISLAVKSVENAAKELKDKVKTQGGYIESEDFSTLNEWDDTKRMSFTIRIPKNNVDGFLEFLDGEGESFPSRKTCRIFVCNTEMQRTTSRPWKRSRNESWLLWRRRRR